MNGRRGAWLVLALVAGPVLAGPQTGRLEVTVLDDVTGNPVILGEVVLTRTGFWAGTMTDDDGLAVFDPVPVDNYTLTTQPMMYPYYRDQRSVAVGASPPATEVTVRLERVEPTPYVEIMEPEGTVGNTVPVTYRFYQNDFHWLTRVRIEAVPSGHAAPTQEISDLTAGQLGDSTQVGTTTLADGLTPVEIRERSVEWDTTGLYNDAYTLRVIAWYEDPWDPGGDDIEGHDERNLAVRNLVFGDVTTSAGNPDYFLFDAKEGSGFEHPTITFEFKDEGQTSNEQGPYHYDWTAMVLTTQCEDPETACDAYVTGTATSPGTITVYLNDTAAQTAAGQQQIGELTAEHWGTLTFELCVEERETGDYYYYRMPYQMTIPETVPGTGLPGHRADFGTAAGGGACMVADYYLDDSEDASWFQVDTFSPDLAIMGTANPGTQARHHYCDEEVSPITVFKAKPYIVVFRGVDSHGDDGNPRTHRERENKRMIPVNGRPGPQIESLTIGTYGDNPPLDANPGNGLVPATQVGLRIYPGKMTATEAVSEDRAKVLVQVKTTKPNCDVVLRSFDVDDPSSDEAPIDQEQTWPAANADNNSSLARGKFENQQDEIEKRTDANGEATAIFTVGQQPGDNYRIVACLKDDKDAMVVRAKPADSMVRVFTLGAQGTGPEEEVPSSGGPSDYRATGVLTVWQRVFYEYDRMWKTSTDLKDDASGGQPTIVTGTRLLPIPGVKVGLFDRTGQTQMELGVISNEDIGAGRYRVTLDAPLQQDFAVANGAFAAQYEQNNIDESLMSADATLVPPAYAAAYVVFEAIAGAEGRIPSLAIEGIPGYYQDLWFNLKPSKNNVVWLIGGDYGTEAEGGRSLHEENWAAVFCRRIRADYQPDNVATAIQ